MVSLAAVRHSLLRAGLICVGLGAAAWGFVNIPAFWRDAAVERVGFRIILGEPYKFDDLTDIASDHSDNGCRARVARGKAVIALRIAEEALAGGLRDQMDDRIRNLQMLARGALACTPGDALLWLMLYWVENARNGFHADHFKFLRMSYAMGPNEGWIAIRRNRIAIAAYSSLPDDLAAAAVKEFAEMLDSGLQEDVIATLTGPGWPIRQRLLDAVVATTERQRAVLYRLLYNRGVDIEVPGIPRIVREFR